ADRSPPSSLLTRRRGRRNMRRSLRARPQSPRDHEHLGVRFRAVCHAAAGWRCGQPRGRSRHQDRADTRAGRPARPCPSLRREPLSLDRLLFLTKAHTTPSAATTAYTRDTGLKPTGGDTAGTLLRYRTCSMSGRMCTTSGRPCGATNRRADIGFGGHRGRGLSSLDLAEACVSRTHRRHRRCRPPVLKTGTITGPHALPYCFSIMTTPAASARGWQTYPWADSQLSSPIPEEKRLLGNGLSASSQAGHLGFTERREVAGELYVLLELGDGIAPDDDRTHGQAEGEIKRFLHG